MQIAQQLHLDVPGPLDELLHEHAGAAEGGLALALGAFQGHGQFVFAVHHPHAAAAAPVGRLEDHRPAEVPGDRQRVGLAADGPRTAGQDRHARTVRQFAGLRLVPQRPQEFDPRAHERDPGRGTGGGEVGVLGEEAVAGMDAIDAVGLGQRHDGVDVEVGADRLARAAHHVGLVRLEAVQREAILVGVDGHRADAQFVGRPEHADGDLAAVGDEQFGDGPHGRVLP